MTSLTLMVVALIAYGLLSKAGAGKAIALAGATPAGAAAVVGTVAVPTFYAVATLVAAPTLLLATRGRLGQKVRAGESKIPGFRALALLLLVAVVVTLVAPIIFNGQTVLGSGGTSSQLQAGLITKSNIAQLLYLSIGICTFYMLATARAPNPTLVGWTLATTTLLSLWAWSHQQFMVPYPENLFDNSPFFVKQETLPNGDLRVRGVFTEPAGLATSCITAIAYSVSRIGIAGRRERITLLGVLLAATFLGFIATSTTFFIAGAILICVAAVAFVARQLKSRARIATSTICVGVGTLLAFPILLPFIYDGLTSVIEDKLGSSSYLDRSTADSLAYRALFDTFGFGVGLGSNRASSFIATFASSAGLAGIGLLLYAVARVVVASRRIPASHPIAWALLALFIAKFISGPDLSDPSGLLWVAAGTLAALPRERQAQLTQQAA